MANITNKKTYYLPESNIRIEETSPDEIEKLWNKLNKIHSFF